MEELWEVDWKSSMSAMLVTSLFLARDTGCASLQTHECVTDLPLQRMPRTEPMSDLATSVLAVPGVM